MNTAAIRQQLHRFIDSIEDKRARAIYTLFEEEIDTDTQRKKLIRLEREKYLRGEGKSYSPEEVKALALNKANRNAI